MIDRDHEVILQMQGVVKTYPTGDSNFTALDNIKLDIYKGEFLGVLGKSGAGKTTLLNMISGVSGLSSGKVLFWDQNPGEPVGTNSALEIHMLDEDAKAVWRGRNLGIVYQSFELMPSLNLVENVMLPQDFSGVYHPTTSKERALELLDLVEIAEHAYKIPAHISGGQKQRVAIARALVNDPPLIIADEPTGNLDTVTADIIFRIFERLSTQGKTIVMVTHDESLEDRFSRRVHIVDGKLVDQQGMSPSSIAKTILPTQKNKAVLEILSSTNPFNNFQTIKPPTNGNGRKNGESSSKEKSLAIDLREVVKTYENAAGKFIALKGINLQFEYGEFVSIIGKSGCGKSTLLNMVTGIDHPTSGSVVVGGKDIYSLTESQRAAWRGRNVGVVFQFFQLLPTLTLLENTMLPMDYSNIYGFRERPDRAMALLKMVGLEKQANKLPANVSSGQQQSAAIARALATDPSIILADEPTGNLDSRSADVILNLFGDLAKQGKTILIVTHDPSLAQRTDKTVILSDGEAIDHTVAQALPFLDHPQMLKATHQIKKQVYLPGSLVIHQGEAVDHFFMIANGEVDVIVNTKIPETTVSRLGPGQFFGEVSLTLGGNSIAGIRAGSKGPVELITLSKEEFLGLIKGSPRMEYALAEVARLRMKETQTILGNQA